MKRIVLVDDQPILGTIYRAKFTAAGFQVEVAVDGKQALETIGRTKPDLVILDLDLPELNGMEVLKRLRVQPSFLTLPIIIFYANARRGIAEEAIAAGATMVLSKSNTSPKEMIDIVNKTLGQTPQTLGLAQPSESPTTNNDAAAQSRARGSIVLLEDHADTRAIISFVLRRKGHHVTCVHTRAEAAMLAQSEQVDLFLINRGRDDSSASFCRETRAAFPNSFIIAYSTAASPAEKDNVLRAGASRYLGTPEELMDVADISSRLITQSQELAA